MEPKYKIFDIAANLTSTRYQGIYNSGQQKHKPDLNQVIYRAKQNYVTHMVISATHLHDFKDVLTTSQLDSNFYCTYGVHPCSANEYVKREIPLDDYFNQIEKEIATAPKDKLVAIGECGLDYDRLFYTPKDIQLKYFI